ncbi:MAG: CoA-binding protein [Candidatus Tectimicrobiota bacterium]
MGPASFAGDEDILAILRSSRTLAVVGCSPDPERDSHVVAHFLQARGYRIIPVNPNATEILGEPCYPSLEAVPDPVEVVDVFRRPEDVPAVVEEAVWVGATALWLQEGVVNVEAARRAREAGLTVVMDRCMLKEWLRFKEELATDHTSGVE